MFDRIENCKKRSVIGVFNNLREVVEYIKNPEREEIETIKMMRQLGKSSPQYKPLKLNLPCFITNFRFRSYVADKKNILGPTGYLYLDIDEPGEYSFNTAYVCAYWKSVSDTGYGLMVKVDGLTPENLKIVAKEIANALSIPFDKNAISYDRNNILSFDPDAYYNDNVEVFNASEIIASIPQTAQKVYTQNSYYNNNSPKKLTLHCNRSGTRYNNLEEFKARLQINFDNNGVMDLGAKNKIPYTQLYLPNVIRLHNRDRILSSFAIGFVSLNTNVSLEILIERLNQANLDRCMPPLEFHEIVKMAKGIYKRKDTYESKPNATRRFLYDPQRKWEKYEKNSINMKYLNADRRANSLKKVENAILELYDAGNRYWKSDVTKVTRMHPDTVAKYYLPAFKEVQKILACKHYYSLLDFQNQYTGLYYKQKRNVGMLSFMVKHQKEQKEGFTKYFKR